MVALLVGHTRRDCDTPSRGPWLVMLSVHVTVLDRVASIALLLSNRYCYSDHLLHS